MILVDSSVWIDFFRANITPQTTVLKSILGVEEVAVGDLILIEVLQGCEDEKTFKSTRRLLEELDFIRIGGHRLAIESARNYRHLRSKGYTVRKTIDVIIATKCILTGMELLHNDRDFIPFEKHLGLKSITPNADALLG